MAIEHLSTRTRICKRCGAPISSDATLGQCPKCLLNVALGRSGLVPDCEAEETDAFKVRLFDDYELLELVARGGMGVVYRARQVSLNRIVALKVISTGELAAPAAVERFRTEAEAAARLEHPNIVPIYEIGVHEEQHYFTMRFLEGGTLTERLSQRRFAPPEAVALMITVARAVQHAHRFGILHRDIKPGNILFDAKGEPFVADFSLAKLLGTESGLTRSAAVLGTPSYMAPEQITGAKQVSTAADVYGLGAVLYELLTGRPPFSAPSPIETMRRALDMEPERPRQLNPAIDRDLETICLKCLDKDPTSRYGSADDLAEDLDSWRSHRPLAARPVTTTERVLKWARRKPAVATLVLAMHLIALAGLLGIIWQARRASNLAALATTEALRANAEAAKAVRQSQRAEDELWKAQLSEARAVRIAGGTGARVRARKLLETLVKRPDLTYPQQVFLRQEAIAQSALTDLARGTNSVPKRSWQPLGWNRNLDRYLDLGESSRLNLYEFSTRAVLASFEGPSPDAVLGHAIISPDERFVAAAYESGRVRAWDIASSQLLLDLALADVGYSKGPWFAEDGRSLLIVSADGLLVQSLDPLQPVRRLKEPLSAIFARFAPDSRSVAAIMGDHAIEVLDATTGEVRCHYHTQFPAHVLAWHPDGKHLAISGDRGKLELHEIHWQPDGKASMNLVAAFVGHLAFVDRIGFSFDGDFILSSGWDGFSIIWDVRTGRALLRDPNTILSTPASSGEKIVLIEAAETAERIATFERPVGFQTFHSIRDSREPFSMWIDADARFAATAYNAVEAGREGECFIWTFPQGRLIGTVPGIWTQFAADGRSLFTFELEGNKIYRYSLENPENFSATNRALVYQGVPGERVNTGRMMSDGRTLAIAATGAIVFLDTKGERPIRKWNTRAHVIEVSADGQYLAAMYHKAPSSLWKIQSETLVYQGPQYSDIAFSGDNQHFSVSTQHDVQIRRLRDRQTVFHPFGILGTTDRPDVRFSKDGSFFGVLLERRFVRLIETATGRTLADLTPPSTEPNLKKIRFTSDDRWLVAVGVNGESIGWNLPAIRAELQELGLDWTLSSSAEAPVTGE